VRVYVAKQKQGYDIRELPVLSSLPGVGKILFAERAVPYSLIIGRLAAVRA
jgi:hypothetical protein